MPVRVVDRPENSLTARPLPWMRLLGPDKLVGVTDGVVLEDGAMPKAVNAAQRRPISLTIRADLIGAARALKVNASEAAEAGIAAAVRQAREAAWLEANREAIARHTAWLDEHGIPLEPATHDMQSWFAAMDRLADGLFMADGREQPCASDID